MHLTRHESRLPGPIVTRNRLSDLAKPARGRRPKLRKGTEVWDGRGSESMRERRCRPGSAGGVLALDWRKSVPGTLRRRCRREHIGPPLWRSDGCHVPIVIVVGDFNDGIRGVRHDDLGFHGHQAVPELLAEALICRREFTAVELADHQVHKGPETVLNLELNIVRQLGERLQLPSGVKKLGFDLSLDIW